MTVNVYPFAFMTLCVSLIIRSEPGSYCVPNGSFRICHVVGNRVDLENLNIYFISLD